VQDHGICVRAWDWSETSQTLWLFTRQRGLVRCVAKGSKRANSSFSGGIELLTRGELVVSLRALEKASQAMCTLTAWDLAEIFPGCRASLTSFHIGMAFADLVQHGLTENDPHEELFDAMVVALRALRGTASDELSLAAFAWSVLEQTGHAPRLDADVRTETPLAPAASYAFSPALGGFTRDDALAERGASAHWTSREAGQVWRVREATLGVLRSLESAWNQREQCDGFEASSDAIAKAWSQLAPCDDEGVRRAARLLLRYFREVFSCEPKAVGQLLEVWERGT
jgi:DNA repair protein RecO